MWGMGSRVLIRLRSLGTCPRSKSPSRPVNHFTPAAFHTTTHLGCSIPRKLGRCHNGFMSSSLLASQPGHAPSSPSNRHSLSSSIPQRLGRCNVGIQTLLVKHYHGLARPPQSQRIPSPSHHHALGCSIPQRLGPCNVGIHPMLQERPHGLYVSSRAAASKSCRCKGGSSAVEGGACARKSGA